MTPVPRSRRIATSALLFLSCSAAAANSPPTAPVITEPPVGRIINPSDLHMECGGFSDVDPGDSHVCTDWEVRLISTNERVWSTLCIGGVERLHTHLGDGTFEGTHAGRDDLLANTQYRLRVRHRDSSADPLTEWSAWTERLFTTGEASVIFPLEADDIADSPAPAWVDLGGAPVLLPAAGTPASVRLESAAGDPLLEILGAGGASNQIINPGSLAAHVPVRVRISAGSSGLVLPENDLSFTTHDGAAVTVFIPGLNLAPLAERFLWISAAGSTYEGAAGETTPVFSTLARGTPTPWAVRQPGYRVEVVAQGFRLPVNIAFVPNPGPDAHDPLYYVTELYGTIKVVMRDGHVHDYATGLLNFNPTGNFPGSGEQGVTGIAVHPTTGDVYAAMLYSSQNGVENVPHYPKIVRFTSTDGGMTAATQTTILNMTGETQGQSHQVSNVTFGPDGKLYVHMGDGFTYQTAANLESYRGKILRMNTDGTAPTDNPFYTSGTVTARDYVYSYGLRNPFGGAWRSADGAHYQVENGPSVDRLAKVVSGRNFGWNNTDASMATLALYNWAQATGPVNIAFVQPETFGGSGFPAEKQGHLFVSESGPTWATGPQSLGKRISEFVLDAAGNRQSGPTPLIEYTGSGKATVCALAAGPDGLYFSDLYKDLDYATPIDGGSNILRVRFVGDADFSANVVSGPAPLSVQFTNLSTVPSPTAWSWSFGDGGTSTEQSPSHVYADDGLFTVRLTVTSAGGLSVEEKTAFIRVGAAPKVALIGVSLPPTASDAAAGQFLRDLGYDVTHYDDEPANRPTAAQLGAANALVVVSSTVTSGNIAGEFRTVNVPLLFWENGLLRSNRESLVDSGLVASGTQISIADATHPITQGLPLGPLTVFNAASNTSIGFGTQGPGTRILARRLGSTSDSAIIVAEAGAQVALSYITPARRVFLFFEDISFLQATDAAKNIYRRSACWAAGLVPPEIVQHPAATAACQGESVTLSVTASGSSPFTYQWRRNGVPITGATARTYIITEASAADEGTYDVIVNNPCSAVNSSAAVLALSDLCCPADFNGENGVTVQDIYDFLAVWQASAGQSGVGLAADFNDSGSVTVQDIYDFLAAWNAGCP